MTPGQGNTIIFHSNQQLPRLRLRPSKDFYCADMAPFKGPRLASCLASRTTEKQGHRQKQLTQTKMRLLKTHFFTPILDLEKSHRIELS